MTDPSGAADEIVGGARSVPAAAAATTPAPNPVANAGRNLPDGVLMIGRIGRAHGVRGDVLVDPRTDDPDVRFAAGQVIVTDPPSFGPLTVQRSYWHSGKMILNFEGFDTRNAVETLRGVVLVVDAAERQPLDDDDEFYDSDLEGLRVLDSDGNELGVVTDVVHSAASDLLGIRLHVVPETGTAEHLIPFLKEMVPTVDVRGGFVVIAPPEGLFDL